MVASTSEVMEENNTIKALLAMLQVRRDDFVFNPQQTIAAQQEAIGLRLLRNLEGSPPGAAQQEQQQMQQQQQGGSGGGAGRRAVPVDVQLQQQQQRRSEAAVPTGGGAQQQQQPTPQLLAFDASPCLLPITPLMRTCSPKIAAMHGVGGEAGLLTTGGGAPHTVVPASPYDFPAESQIAAAALTAKHGDTAAALLTLLDKAVEGRLERQREQQQPMSQQQQPSQQQQQLSQQAGFN